MGSYYYDTEKYKKSDTQYQTLVLSVNEDGAEFCLGRKKNGLPVSPGPYCKIKQIVGLHSDDVIQTVPADWIKEYKISLKPATKMKATTRSYNYGEIFEKSDTQSEAVILDANARGWEFRRDRENMDCQYRQGHIVKSVLLVTKPYKQYQWIG